VKTGIQKTKDNMDSHLRGNDNIENGASEIHSDFKMEKVLVHAGNMFAYQNPKNFWKQIKLENDKGNKIVIRFIGSVDKEILDYLNSIGLNMSVQLAGFLPYREMIKEILKADMLLVCSTEPRHVPGKLFEALRTGNPIIAFGDNNEEVKKIIEDANAGMMFKYDESGEEFLNNSNKFKNDRSPNGLYDRKNISKSFCQILLKL
jgi:glycosyltransferase involved in cell wall biosynthesis